jgi:UDP-2,3-diacylglucosamine pyrophosphatase LpxH
VKRGLVISDLHLFARRSEGEALLPGFNEEIAGADVLVLNGDIFDFNWSQLPTEEVSIAVALQWLRELADGFSGEKIHYILGNHDCLWTFRDSLDELARQVPVLEWHEHRLQLGRALFLHGDCANRKMDGAALARKREDWSRERPRTRVHSAMYGVVDVLGLSRRFHQCYFPQGKTVKRVAHHLDQVMPDWRREVDDCFFGHTHRPFRDHRLDGVRFHNTGSGIRGMGFQPLSFDVSEDTA